MDQHGLDPECCCAVCARQCKHARLVHNRMMFQGGMAVGSAVWGAPEEHIGTPFALAIAAAGLAAGLTLARRFPLTADAAFDLSPGRLAHALSRVARN